MSDDEDYFLPLEDQRVFGAGIKRKRVPFVRSSEHELSTTRPASTPATNIADTYLSIVLKKTAGDVAENLKEDDSSLRYLSTYGWNPDSRLGLGASGREGIREPLKGRIKNDKAGLGSGLDKDGDRLPAPLPPPKKIQKLNAKQARKGADEARKRGDKLRNMFFQNDEVLKYLGENA
ncbi:hypothetical protein N7526_009436 [Penicillium atrosanguineum]|nr:hypothetical protein N7526_009436 [Penicillium atrosanguineum]